MMSNDPIQMAIDSRPDLHDTEAYADWANEHAHAIETALLQHQQDGGFTLDDTDLAKRTETAVSYLRMCPSSGPERITAIETVLLAADRFSQVVPRIEAITSPAPKKENDDGGR